MREATKEDVVATELPQAEGPAEQPERPDAKVTYVVLERVGMAAMPGLDAVGRAGKFAWVELATVELPKRAHRRSAVLAALGEAGQEPSPSAVFRVLSVEAAQEFRPTAKPPAPVQDRWEIVQA